MTDALNQDREKAAELVHKVDGRKPKFITAAQRLREQSREMGGEMLGAFAEMPVPKDIQVGSILHLKETALNEGANSTGVRIELTGPGITGGMLQPDLSCSLRTYSDGAAQKQLYSQVKAFNKSQKVYSVDFDAAPFESVIEVETTLRGRHVGSGSVVLHVIPLVAGTASAATFEKQVIVNGKN